MTPPPQTTVVKRGANHGLHVILSILTCGLWAITGWPIAAAMGRKTKTTTYPQPGPGYPPAPGYPQQQPPAGAYPPPPYAQHPGQPPHTGQWPAQPGWGQQPPQQ